MTFTCSDAPHRRPGDLTSPRPRPRHPDDIDLWSGGISEKPLPGSMVGPTLACLIAEQFRVLKYGDRYWFENQGYPSSFTHGEIRGVREGKTGEGAVQVRSRLSVTYRYF